ncbi:phage tail protein I [Zymomonas mobilis]|uniref:Phage tail protein I n=1 Tax=Zymomonas mobilis subsp. mobilis (strain ATCC 31821 / ZM4 / CP4) TaxID=264203 RepID=A0A806DA82_ZYMMO|nr:phage tail protein I [Zymomonas mobilis]ADC33799.1 phage tail protein I [Zymomonas mobilis subsp. mobilis ZM4 = ATCC 31821]AHB11069.1 phage tail protein, P2 protein I family [Zymomonas mobilis subsp. mobilis str. CP4 = NRRL B-14023]AHJ71436.1 Bacteriophage P2-related tail formation protein [Zymomonas mobilis subsp. mobilis NRRL B-12526]AHJ73276.1 Bacteriophage P2-related tail formation protein [Zymomonas mobilis subsp. mobilis str. CP4 = NRRL B-14023]TWE21956.1 phage tail P2-like protein [Z
MITSLLPPNSTDLERALEKTSASNFALPAEDVKEIWNPDTCSTDLLPYCAVNNGLNQWSDDWPENVKRQRISTAIEIARHQGTVKSIRDVVSAFGSAVEMREWFETEPRGKPRTFDLVLTVNSQSDASPSAKYVDDIVQAIVSAKPAAAQFLFTMGIDTAGQIGEIGFARPVISIHLISEDAR